MGTSDPKSLDLKPTEPRQLDLHCGIQKAQELVTTGTSGHGDKGGVCLRKTRR